VGNRRLTYEDLREWLRAEALAFEQERQTRVVGRRGPDGESVYRDEPRGLYGIGVANADLVADFAGRDRKTILAYRKADWPKSAWLPFMQQDWKPFPQAPELTEEDLEREFCLIVRRYRRAGRHRTFGEDFINLLEQGHLDLSSIDRETVTDEELAEIFQVTVRTIRRRKVRDLL
jgi:hypothetical protein